MLGLDRAVGRDGDGAKISSKSPSLRISASISNKASGQPTKKRPPTLPPFQDSHRFDMGGVGKHVHGLHPDEAIFLHEHF